MYWGLMSTFDPVRRSLEHAVASGWAPGIVAGVRHSGATEIFATGRRAFDSDDAMLPATPFRIASLSKPVGGALAASMIADGLFGVDDEVAPWLPELADPAVLTRPDAPLDDTVEANGPVTVRHLLTATAGLGVSFAETPHADALKSFGWGPNPPDMTADEYMARLGALPLAYQPGERWQYHTTADILSVFLTRVAGRPLHDLLEERITGPLGMAATGFTTGDRGTLPTQYRSTTDGLVEAVEYEQAFVGTPPFESLGGGLLSTVPDYLAFLAALADDTLLPRAVREEMFSDQLTSGQREGITEMAGADTSWGWQVSVQTGPGLPWTAPGRYGWTGGSGTSAYVDPSRDLIGVVFSQRFMAGPREDFAYFWEPLAASV